MILSRLLERRSISPLQAWIQDIGYGNLSADSGMNVTQSNSTGLAAVYACTSLIADTISTLPADSYIKWDGSPKPWRPRPGWLDDPVPNDPSITWTTHINQVVLSLLFDGNAYIIALPNVFDPTILTVVDPSNVQVKHGVNGRPSYVLRHNSGATETFDSTTMIHIPRNMRPGGLRGMSPIDEARQTLGTAMAAQKHGGRFFRNGAKLSGVLQTSAELTQEQADKLRDKFTSAHTSDNAYKVGVLTGGATYTATGVTPEQAQFLETLKFHTLEVARIFRVPPLLIQVNDPGAVSYASADAAVVAFEKHTIRPIIVLLERAYARLLPHDRAYLRIDTQGLLRGDPKTRFDGYSVGLSEGFFNRDEVRSWEEMAPIAGGWGQVYTVPQRTINLAHIDDQAPPPFTPASGHPGSPDQPANPDEGAPLAPSMPMKTGAMMP